MTIGSNFFYESFTMKMTQKMGAKVTWGVDDMQSGNIMMMTICTMTVKMMVIMRRDCENWIGCDDALEAEAG